MDDGEDEEYVPASKRRKAAVPCLVARWPFRPKADVSAILPVLTGTLIAAIATVSSTLIGQTGIARRPAIPLRPESPAGPRGPKAPCGPGGPVDQVGRTLVVYFPQRSNGMCTQEMYRLVLQGLSWALSCRTG